MKRVNLTDEESHIVFLVSQLLAELSEGTFYCDGAYFSAFADKIIEKLLRLNGGEKTDNRTFDLMQKDVIHAFSIGYYGRYARRNDLLQWTKEDAEKARDERIYSNQCY